MNLDELFDTFAPPLLGKKAKDLSPGARQAAQEELNNFAQTAVPNQRMGLDDLADVFIPPIVGRSAAPKIQSEPVSEEKLNSAKAFADALSSDPTPGTIGSKTVSEPAEIEMFGDERDLAPPSTPSEPAEIEMFGDERDLIIPSSPTGTTVSSPESEAIDASETSGTTKEVVDTSQNNVLTPPRNPLQVPRYARDVNQQTSQSDIDLQNKQNEAAVEAAEIRAKVLEDEMAIELAAKKSVEDRIRTVQKQQDRAREELSRRSDVLARAAEQRLAERPGAGVRSAGRALLAIAAGMGSQAAANLFYAHLEDEERNERNDIARKNADMEALSRSFNVGSDEFSSLGASAISEQQLSNAQSLAREKLALKQIDTQLSKLAPGIARQQGEMFLNELKRNAAKRESDLAQDEFKAELQRRALNIPTKGSRTPSAPPKPPKAPVPGESGHEGEQEKDFNRRNNQYRNIDLPYYENVILPAWKNKEAAKLTKTPRQTPQWEIEESPQVPAPTQSGAPPTNKIPSGKSVVPSAKQTADAKAPNKLNELDKDLNKDDIWAKRYGIRIPGSNIVLRPSEGFVPNDKDPEVLKLKTSIARTKTFIDSASKLASIVSEYNNRGMKIEDFVKKWGSALNIPIGTSDTDIVENAIRNVLKFEVSILQEQGVLQKADDEKVDQIMLKSNLFSHNPMGAALVTNFLFDHFAGGLANNLDAHGYDSKSFREYIDAKKNEVMGFATPPETSEEKSKRLASSDQARIDFMNNLPGFYQDLGVSSNKKYQFNPLTDDDISKHTEQANKSGEMKWKFSGESNPDASKDNEDLQTMGSAEIKLKPNHDKLNQLFIPIGEKRETKEDRLKLLSEGGLLRKKIQEAHRDQVKAALNVIDRTISKSNSIPEWLIRFEVPKKIYSRILALRIHGKSGAGIEANWDELRPFIAKYLLSEGDTTTKFDNKILEE